MAGCGTTTGYTGGCRCRDCRDAWAVYQRGYKARRAAMTPEERRRKPQRKGFSTIDHNLLADLLNELFPYGLTDDCPAAKARAASSSAA